MKSLAEFKRALQSTKQVTVQSGFNGFEKETRPLLKVLTCGVVTGHAITEGDALVQLKDPLRENPVKLDGFWYTKYHLNFQKAKYSLVHDNVLELKAYKGDHYMVPSPDFEEGQTWFKLTLD